MAKIDESTSVSIPFVGVIITLVAGGVFGVTKMNHDIQDVKTAVLAIQKHLGMEPTISEVEHSGNAWAAERNRK